MGARYITLRTVTPIPSHWNIRSFQLVEVPDSNNPYGRNTPLKQRRYVLKLQVAVEYPKPCELDDITSPEQILGADDGVKKHLALSNGEFIHNDESKLIQKERRQRKKAQAKAKGSKRQRKLRHQTQKRSKRRRANRKRILISSIQRCLSQEQPKARRLRGQVPQRHEPLRARHKASTRRQGKAKARPQPLPT